MSPSHNWSGARRSRDSLSNALTATDQDERLNLLSHSIGRQNHLSVQIGDELDIHHELLEDTEAGMDRTAARLNRARRSLDTVADNAKQHGECGVGSNLSRRLLLEGS